MIELIGLMLESRLQEYQEKKSKEDEVEKKG
jgi:hypothetical protein